MAKKLLIAAAAITILSIPTIIIYTQNEKTTLSESMKKKTQDGFVDLTGGRRNLAASIHQMMGGEVAMGTSDSTFYSSTPFKPRQFTHTGTAFIHYKNPEEQDADGETTFPPTKSPTMQFNGWFSPTESPSRVPTKYPATLDPSNVGEVTWHPSKKPTSNPSHQPTWNPSRFPTKEPSREPTKIPTKVMSSGPSELPTREPSKGPSKLPTRDPSRNPSQRPTNEPSKGLSQTPTLNPSREPTPFPTLKPIVGFSATTIPTKRPNIGNFYCGSSVYEAGKCETPCPNGIADCPTGFCYAVSECALQTDTPSKLPTKEPTHSPTQGPSSTDFFCGLSLIEASSNCEHPCPAGSPTECPDDLLCYASTGCKDGLNQPPTRSPSYDPSGSFYCGSSFQMASEQCLVPCPSGVSAECPPDQACYANTPCENKNGFFCGTSLVNASASCEFSCLSGLDSECPSGLSCYETQTCKSWGESKAPTRAPKVPDVEDGTKYCGYSYEHAATMCTQACPSGHGDECPESMSCFSHTPCEEMGSFYCGVSWNNASSSCQYPCPTGTDSDCPPNTHCYAYTTCDETGSFMCGTTFEDAASSCDKPCPSGSPTDCPSTMSCFTHTTCATDTDENQSAPVPSPPYIPGDSYFCGKSFLEASSQCTDPCPTRLDSECPDGEECYGNTPCPTRMTYFCGANLHEASAMCEHPCPTGESEDCPNGLSCFAFTTCADKNSFYCGNNFIEADSSCDIPCPSGLSSDCPQNLTCFAHTTCAIEPATEPAGPVDSYFCGSSFDEATRDCSLPCPSGRDIDCLQGMNCYSHTSCNDRDSFMCGYSWDHAAGSCSNPCPSGEHSDCPEDMSCFAYTPCNNAGSFFCGTTFDEASTCDHPCPSGESWECPDNLSCFSYTSCGTGDFNTKSPTQAPTGIKLEPQDSFYCGSSFEDASSSCEYKCPNGSTDCPTGLACFEYTSCVGQADGEPDSFFCGTTYTDANEKCQVPCPNGTSLECPDEESCIPFTTCNANSRTEISTTFFCGVSKEEAEASCDSPCPSGPEDCPDNMSCFSFTTCAPLPVPTPATSSPAPSSAQITRPNSFYCGTSFENATSACSIPCSGGSSSECPVGQSCYGFTSCSDRDSFYCGESWDQAASTCSKPCPSGSNDECDAQQVCFGYTPCSIPEADIPVDSFYCGATFTEASAMCTDACPSSKHSDCPDGQLCHPYTPCGKRDSFFCGLSWTDAATSCLIPCPSGSSADCPDNQFCFPSTPCDEVESFFCGSNFEDATTGCNISCESGQSSECPDGQGCFAYTLCNEDGTNAVPTPTLAPIPKAPLDSFYCGTSFDDASTVCEHPCPSGLSGDCPGDLLCFASTPCSDRGSFFCGTTWEDAAASCTQPCERGLSSDCPTGQQCFGYTPCSKSESFYCGESFEDASRTCADACPSGKDWDCPGQETCHKYTPCNDITPLSSNEPTFLPFPIDSFYCGIDFVDAAMKCYLPCPTGSAAECPVGEACYGNTPCGGGDSFFCGITWYDASSECKVPCPSGLDEDCPQGSKCFGYTPCSDTNSFYCGTDFYDASTNCVKPCPSGSSSECPFGLACFPNTPCDIDPTPMHEAITPNLTTTPPSRVPTHLPTPPPTLALTTSAPHISMFLYCGTDIDNINCLLPCPNGDECPLNHECYATQKCSDSFYCGETFAAANSTCSQACPDGRDESCPFDMYCYAQTSCASPHSPPHNIVDVGSSYCGRNYTDAATSCPLACPSGSSAECTDLGPEYSCFANTPCDDRDSYYCGTTWSHAASNCLFPCPSSDDNDCPDGTFCFPYTSCNKNDSFMCGTSFDHASSCERPCPSGSSDACPFGESCFTHTTCKATAEEPTASPAEPYFPGSSFYCGTSFLDAATQCAEPCPTRLDSDCPSGQQCFANTPCANRETYFCGNSLEEASASCEHPCPTGRSDACPENLSCFAFTTCADKGSYFCGANYIDASSTCNTPCESGLSSDCPDELTCFAFTTCNKDGVNSAFCGTSFEDQNCTKTCSSSDDCPNGEACFPFSNCQVIDTEYPVESFYCGTTFEEASMTCSHACPSSSHAECPDNQFCFPNTPCQDHGSYYCGLSWTDAATKCLIPCPSGSSSDCPENQSCFPSTPCDQSDSFFCGSTFEDAGVSCSSPCPTGQSYQCPDGEGCFAYTLCNEDGTNAVPTPTLAPIPKAPLDSFYCGTSFDDATLSCEYPCPSGQEDCPEGLFCFSGTSCEASGSFFCGTSWEEASASCTLPCANGLSSDCPVGELCFGYTPCMKDTTFYCGESFEDASSTCDNACPSGLDSECPGLERCYKYTTCADGVPSYSAEDDNVQDDLFFCGVSLDDASARCAIPCSSHSSTECPVGQACFAHTTCSINDIPAESYYCGLSYENASEQCSYPCPDGHSSGCPGIQQCYAYTPCAKPESFFCGKSIDDANDSCAIPCPTGKSNTCPTGESCYAYTTCEPITGSPTEQTVPTKGPTNKPTSDPTDVPTGQPTPTPKPTNEPTLHPTKQPTRIPTEKPTHAPSKVPTIFPTKLPTKYPTKLPTKSPIIPVLFDVPEDSFYCGVTFDHASDVCAVACPSGNDDCPPGLTCFGNTPCGDKDSFFCGTSFEDANDKCTTPCPNGSADECPSGESCFAYTMCTPITDEPTQAPTFEPTNKPTLVPSSKPTLTPTAKPSPPPATEVVTPQMEDFAEEATQDVIAEVTQDVIEEVNQDVIEEVNQDTEEAEEEAITPDNSGALVIELKPCEDPLAMTVNQGYWRSWSSDRTEMCNKFDASDIDASTYSHLVYSFASISANGHLEPWVGSWDEVDKYKEFNNVKKHNSNIQTIIAVSQGVFYGPGMDPVTFHEVAETMTTRMAFAQSVVSFLELYDFNGIDIDWEAPLDTDKGGGPENYERFVLLVEEIRSAFDKSGKKFILTVALPPTGWEIDEYDVNGLSKFVDWFNLMSFDYHTPKNIPKTVGAHSDLKLIDSVVFELLTEAESTKFVLGMAAYGRTYTLADSAARCKELGCSFKSPGLGGCGNTPGFLPFNEIHEYIESESYEELYQDVSSSSMVVVVNEDQMISFDDESTWAIKEDYAEMMCLRGTMLWSIDMLKPNNTSALHPQGQVVEGSDARSLSTLDSSSQRCNLCGDSNIHADVTIEYKGEIVSCADIHNELNSNFVPQQSEHCLSVLSKFGKECCVKASSRSCDICGPGTEMKLVESRLVSYAGSDTTCGDLSDSTREFSFKCSLVRTSLTNLCCVESCRVCPNGGEINADAMIYHDGQYISCADYEFALETSGFLNGSDECDSSVSPFFDICCLAKVESEEAISPAITPSMSPCNICEKDNIHHELKSEAMVEYKGTSISCLDLNSVLAKSEVERSEICVATQSMLFDGCCYEKCSLCGEESLRWDATVKYNNQILSCDELGSMFTLGMVREDSDQCGAMQSAYSSICCFKPPKNKCNLCNQGSTSFEVKANSFVKTMSSSLHCVALVNGLAEREEEGSAICEDSKLAYSERCCNMSSLPNAGISYYDWLSTHMLPSSDVSSTCFLKIFVWSLFVTSCVVS